MFYIYYVVYIIFLNEKIYPFLSFYYGQNVFCTYTSEIKTYYYIQIHKKYIINSLLSLIVKYTSLLSLIVKYTLYILI